MYGESADAPQTPTTLPSCSAIAATIVGGRTAGVFVNCIVTVATILNAVSSVSAHFLCGSSTHTIPPVPIEAIPILLG